MAGNCKDSKYYRSCAFKIILFTLRVSPSELFSLLQKISCRLIRTMATTELFEGRVARHFNVYNFKYSHDAEKR